jgi:hypothetical protein
LLVFYDDRCTNVKKAIIGATEVDMNENKAIFYCSPDFMLDILEFGKHIKVGLQTKGYEDYSGDNLLLCIGFLGKLSENSNSKFKVKLVDVVELMGNRGIKLIKPLKYDPEELAGLEWNLDCFTKGSILVPETDNMYTNSKGETSIRFADYNFRNPGDNDFDLEINEEENIQQNYYGEEIEDKILYPNELGMTDLSDKELLELEEHSFKIGQILDEEYLYYDEERNIRIGLITEETNNISHINQEPLDNIGIDSIISEQVELMQEESSSSTPFHKTTPMTDKIYNAGNIPRPSYSEYSDQLISIDLKVEDNH